MEKTTCPIWGTPAEFEMRDDSSRHYNSPRAGGRYIISESWQQKAEDLDEEQKVLVTSWLVSQRSMGVAEPRISDSLEIDTIRHPSPYQRAENLLKYINSQLSEIGDVFRTTRIKQAQDPNADNLLWVCYAKLLAWSASTKLDEVYYLLEFLEDQDLIASPTEGTHVKVRCRLTVKGHTYIANMGTRISDSTQAFVAMWFDSSLDSAYYEGIKLGIEECGYSAVRIDQTEYLNKIDDRIIAEIRRSKFVVVDLTEEEAVTHTDGTVKGGTRGSVYFEAGFAHGLNIPVIYTCREDSLNKAHFDIRQYPFIRWNTHKELKLRLAQRISAVIGDGSVSYTQSDNGGGR